MWWFASRPREHFTYESDVPEMLVMRAVVGESWKEACFVQFLSTDEDTAQKAERRAEEAEQRSLLPPEAPVPSHTGSLGSRGDGAGHLTPIPEESEASKASNGDRDLTSHDDNGDDDDDAATDVDDLLVLRDTSTTTFAATCHVRFRTWTR